MITRFDGGSKTYEGVSIVCEVQPYPIGCLLDAQDTNAPSGVAVLHAWMT